MARSEADAIRWAEGALRQHTRLCEAYDAWFDHDVWATRNGERSWTLRARQQSGALSDVWTVEAHLFLVACHQLVETLEQIGRQDLLDLLPAQHISHARNAVEHDDDRGWYRRDYRGFGWTVGAGDSSGPTNFFGLEIAPVVDGVREIRRRLPHLTITR